MRHALGTLAIYPPEEARAAALATESQIERLGIVAIGGAKRAVTLPERLGGFRAFDLSATTENRKWRVRRLSKIQGRR
jgi:hypothetical protein